MCILYSSINSPNSQATFTMVIIRHAPTNMSSWRSSFPVITKLVLKTYVGDSNKKNQQPQAPPVWYSPRWPDSASVSWGILKLTFVDAPIDLDELPKNLTQQNKHLKSLYFQAMSSYLREDNVRLKLRGFQFCPHRRNFLLNILSFMSTLPVLCNCGKTWM